MSEGVETDTKGSNDIRTLLGIFPHFVRRELVSDRSFRRLIGLEANEYVTFGRDTVFARTEFFEEVAKVLSGFADQAEIGDQAGNQWFLSLEKNSAGEKLLRISSEETSFLSSEFFGFFPEAEDRLRGFEAALQIHGFASNGLESWKAILNDRSITGEEIEILAADLERTPYSFTKDFKSKIEAPEICAADMVPQEIEYFENLCGKAASMTLLDYVTEVVPEVFSNYLEWSEDEGPRMALLMSSSALICQKLEPLIMGDEQFIELAKWARDHGDVFSKVGLIEISLNASQRFPDLAEILNEIVQQIISLEPTDKSGPLLVMMSFIVLVESEVSRTRVLCHWPPFRRRLASIAHAALLAREAIDRTDVEDLCAWILRHHSAQFYLQNLLDLRVEPRWFPDLVDPASLKQELLGRLFNAARGIEGGLCEGAISATLGLSDKDTEFNKQRKISSFFPGPLEGHEDSPKSPIPQNLDEELDRLLSETKLTSQSIVALANTSGVFHIDSGKAERTVEIIRESNFRFGEQLNDNERIMLLHRLAEAASRLRNESLARSVRALARVYREGTDDGDKFSLEVSVCLKAAGAFKEYAAWAHFIGEWINELCFGVARESSHTLLSSVEHICEIEPRLRSELGTGIAALASLH